MRSSLRFVKLSVALLAIFVLVLTGSNALNANAGPMATPPATRPVTTGTPPVPLTVTATTIPAVTATVVPPTATAAATTAATATARATTAATAAVTTGQGGPAQGAAGQAVASATAKCVPAEVAVYVNAPRIHVKCEAPTGPILYFAVGTQDAGQASRVLTLLTSAVTSGKTLSIVYNPDDLSGEAFGCLRQDCRLILSVSMLAR